VEPFAAQGDYDHFAGVVSDGYGIPVEQLAGPHRDKVSVFARRIVAICLREKGYSYPEIGDVLGKRNHTTIIRLVRGHDSNLRSIVAKARTEQRRRILEQQATANEARSKAAVATARDEAQRFLASAPATPRGEAGARLDTGRAEFEAARQTYWRTPEGERERFWAAWCASAFPYDSQRQAAVPPRRVLTWLDA
jgi:vacuolar-type H+-ATPase subunit H